MNRWLPLALLIAATGAASTVAAQAPDGKALYGEHCKKCHGVRGIPPLTMKKKYEKIATFDLTFFEKRSDDSVVKVLAKGKGDDMKSFKEKMSPDEMMAVAKFTRELATKAKP